MFKTAPLRAFAAGLAALAALAPSVNAAPAARPATPKVAPPPVAARSAAAGVASGLNGTSQRFAQALRSIHMTFCASAAQRAFDFLLEGQEGNFTVQPMGPDADRFPVVITLESYHAASGQTRFSTIMVASAAGCTGMYEQVITWVQPCDVVRKQIFSSFSPKGPVYKNVQLLDGGPALQLYTMSNGAGCVSVKKELFL